MFKEGLMSTETKQRLDSMANSVLLVLLSRLTTIIGVPVFVAMLMWFVSTVDAMRFEIAQLRVHIQSGVERQVNDVVKRVDRLEDRLNTRS
jgi:hypothetical protein